MKTLADLGLTEISFSTLVFLWVLLIVLCVFLIAAFFYLKSYGIYKIARTLRLKGAWRSFVPFLRTSIFLEEAQVIQSEKNTAKPKTLIKILYIAKIVFSAVASFIFIRPLTKLIFSLDLAVANGTELNPEIFKSFILTVVLVCISVVFDFVYRIGFSVCLSQILRYFRVKNPKAISVVCFLIPLLVPFVLISANKNAPRKNQPRIYEGEKNTFQINEQ